MLCTRILVQIFHQTLHEVTTAEAYYIIHWRCSLKAYHERAPCDVNVFSSRLRHAKYANFCHWKALRWRTRMFTTASITTGGISRVLSCIGRELACVLNGTNGFSTHTCRLLHGSMVLHVLTLLDEQWWINVVASWTNVLPQIHSEVDGPAYSPKFPATHDVPVFFRMVLPPNMAPPCRSADCSIIEDADLFTPTAGNAAKPPLRLFGRLGYTYHRNIPSPLPLTHIVRTF